MGFSTFCKEQISTKQFRKVFYGALAGAFLIALICYFCGLFLFRMTVLTRIFSDFWETVRFAVAKNPYDEVFHSSYPPVSFLVVYPFALICKRELLELPMDQAISSAPFLFAFCLFFFVCIVVSAFLLTRLIYGKISFVKVVELFCVTLVSLPVLFMFVRGNVALVAFVLVLVFLNFYNSPNRLLRFVAYLSIAVAGVVKFYVLFFVLLLARKGRMLDCLQILVLFLLLFILPFGVYGFNSFNIWLSRLSGFVITRFQVAHAHNLTFVHPLVIIHTIVDFLGWNWDPWLTGITIAVHVAFILFAAILTMFVKSDYKAFTLCTLLCCLSLNPAYLYIGIFFFPLLLQDLKKERISRIKAGFYLLFFTPLIYVHWIGAYLQMFACVTFAVIVLISSVKELRATYGIKSMWKHILLLLSGFVNNGKSLAERECAAAQTEQAEESMQTQECVSQQDALGDEPLE
ncbi:MAG: DUF2029 domain-containing protein [Clostridiales bacterium]|nr:DUF2029 domain-containing protein [Clostridiales bacterium]